MLMDQVKRAKLLRPLRAGLKSLKRPSYSQCVKRNIPYFGAKFYANQGVPRRHHYMYNLFRLEASKSSIVSALEIGTWAGGSAITWASAMKNYCPTARLLCVDIWKPYFQDKDTNSALTVYKGMNDASGTGHIISLFFHNIRAAGCDGMIDVLRIDSTQGLTQFRDQSFDFIYIDGSHYYQDVLRDLHTADRLLKVGGILCGDDLERQFHEGAELGWDFRSKLDRDCWWDCHPGVTVAVEDFFKKPVSAWEGFWAMKKVGPGKWERFSYSSNEFGPMHIPPHLGAWI